MPSDISTSHYNNIQVHSNCVKLDFNFVLEKFAINIYAKMLYFLNCTKQVVVLDKSSVGSVVIPRASEML